MTERSSPAITPIQPNKFFRGVECVFRSEGFLAGQKKTRKKTSIPMGAEEFGRHAGQAKRRKKEDATLKEKTANRHSSQKVSFSRIMETWSVLITSFEPYLASLECSQYRYIAALPLLLPALRRAHQVLEVETNNN